MDNKKIWKNIFNKYQKIGLNTKLSIFATDVIQYFKDKESLLDLGAGLGQDTKFFADNEFIVTCTDVSEDALIEKAYSRICGPEAKADLIVANDVGQKKRGFQSETNEVYIIDKEKNITHIPLELKDEIANEILDNVARKVKQIKKEDIWD